MRLLGAVIAGGRSRRFGSDKALATWEGLSLIERVIDAVRPQVDDLVVCGREMADVRCLPDLPHPDLGPLGGLAAALSDAERRGFSAVLSVPCDAPLLPADLRERLAATGTCAYAATLPVIGLWPATLAGRIGRFVVEDAKRSMRGWAAIAGATAIDLPLANVNTPADLAQLVRNGTPSP